MSRFEPPYPPGLPVGEGWVATDETATVRFPCDRSEVTAAPVGTVQHAGAALGAAAAVAPALTTLPSRVRREGSASPSRI